MKKYFKLTILLFVIAIAIILLNIPTNSYASTINQVYVGNIEEPEVGNLPDRTASSGKDYFVYGDIEWYEVDTDRYLEGNDRFEYGHVYRLVVWVKANQGNEFNTSGSTPNVSGYINSKAATVNKAYGEAAYEVVELTYEYDLSHIKNIKLSGGAIPVIGENYPSKNSWSIPNGEHYTIGNRYRWYDITADMQMDSSYKTFIAGNVYELSIMFYPEEGYEFADAGVMTAVLTDFSSENYSVEVRTGGSSSSTEKLRLVIFTFKRLGYDDIVLTEVSLENGEFPLAGEKPDYSWSVPEGAPYSLTGTMYWTSPNENNYRLTPSDTFDKGQTYYLFIQLIPDDGYRFQTLGLGVLLPDISDEWFLHAANVNEENRSATIWLVMTAKNPSNTVTFNSMGGTEIESQTVEKGSTIIRPYPDPEKDGYVFVDWYVGSRLNYVYNFSNPVTSDFTLYAKWIENIDGLANVNGKMSYYIDGIIQTEYTGLVEYEGEMYYVQNGSVEWGVNGLKNIGGTWYYLENSILQDTYTGLVQKGDAWYYVQKGILKWGERTLVKYDGAWFYVNNSTIDWKYTGLVKYNGQWFYIQNGKLKWGEKTLVKKDGVWYYVNNSTVDFKYTGLVKKDGAWFYVQNGVLKWGEKTLVKYEGYWYYVNNSMLDWNYTGLVQYNGSWYYVQKGVLIWGERTLVKYDGAWFYVNNSTIDWSYTGLVQYNSSWFYVQNGKLKWGERTLVKYDGAWFYVKNSTLDWNYTGLVEYNNTLFYVQKGVLIWGYNGKVEYNGKTYDVKNSMASK